jgi:peroxiredoxin
MAQLMVGDAAPEITLPAIDGSTFDMSNSERQKGHSNFFPFFQLPFVQHADSAHHPTLE